MINASAVNGIDLVHLDQAPRVEVQALVRGMRGSILAGYGAAQAVQDVSFALDKGEMLALIGANGAGKTTMINAMAGLQPIRSGTMRFKGEDITRWPSHQFCERGIAIVPEGRRLFTGMSVADNLALLDPSAPLFERPLNVILI